MSGQRRRRALLVGSASYRDPSFPPLPCAADDTVAVGEVLNDPRIGGFDEVHELLDPTAAQLRERVEVFFGDLAADDLGLLYVSGHGARMVSVASEFFFVAADTVYEDIEQTGVSAGFVTEQLEHSRAAAKVAIFDCCFSGGFNLGFRTRESKSADAADPLTPSGVYLVASSGLGERSWVDPRPVDPRLSLFTAELVAALRTGRGDTGGDGIVDMEELALYVCEQVRRVPAESPQVPRLSAHNVTERIQLARVPTGGPLPPSPLATPPPSRREPVAPGRAEPTGPHSLTELLGYYRDCLESASTPMALLTVDELGERYLCVPGRELLLGAGLGSGDGIPVPEPENELYSRAQEGGGTLWYGYPTVVLPRDRAGKDYRDPRCAPLFIRPVEVVRGPSGDVLRAFGEIGLHPGLLAELLGQDAATQLVRGYRTSWRGGMDAQLIREVHGLRSRLGLEAVQELDPRALEPAIDIGTPVPGLRNTALVFLAERDQSRPNAKVLEDLAFIAAMPERVRDTALAELLGAAAPLGPVPAWTPVLPLACNDGQRAVLESAMTRRLTVATGPPGTGKSQLVVNLVATAVANGQKVLVTSTNNRAVDEVLQRCQAVVPGALVRTGSSGGEMDYRRLEHETLVGLADLPPAPITEETVGARLRFALLRWDEVRREAADKAAREQALLRLGRQRRFLAAELGLSADELRALFRRWNLREIGYWADRVGAARFLGRWRRRRFLRRLSWPGETSAEACAALAAWARNEVAWEAKRTAILGLRTDPELRQALAEKAEQVRQCSRLVLTTAVRNSAHRGRRALSDLLSTAPGGDREQRKQVLDHVRGWASTNQSLRKQFKTEPALFDLVIVDEASQCSIPQVIPALYRANRALIVGDPMQLAPLITLGSRQEAQVRRDNRLSASWLEGRRLNYRRHSAFHALATAAGTELLLDEHYRCHPDIAGLANEQFYRRRLTVLTDVHRLRRRAGPAITWVQVAGEARQVGSNSWWNQAEIEQVDVEVRGLLDALPPDADIGVITPFTEQQKRLAQRWRLESRVRVGTVHAFQGRESDAMVISMTASPTMCSATLRWLGRERNLWNVAITRARSHLVLVGNREVWRRLGPIGPVLVAAAEQTRSGAGSRIAADGDDLAVELFDWLTTAHPHGRVTLAEVLCGYRVDAVVRDGRLGRPILLDRGFAADMPPCRHLRRQFELTRLITSDGGTEAIRLPAWRLFDSAT